jgi:predicted DNA-binding transcriptional regulator AlpA
LLSGSAIRNQKDGRLSQTSCSKRPAAQVAFAKKAADAKAAKGKTNLIAPDLIDGNEQEVAEEAIAAANRAAREHDEGSPHAASAPPAPLGARLLSKREALAIVGVSYPTLWSMMRAGTFPRSRVVGGKSMWLSSEIETWLAALPVRRLKGDEPKETAIASLSSGSENNRVRRGR